MRLKPKSSRMFLRALLILMVVSAWGWQVATATAAPEAKVQAILVWGTDEIKPDNKSLKQLDGKLHEKLAKVFKWQHYF